MSDESAAGVPANDGIVVETNLPPEPSNDSAAAPKTQPEPVEQDDEGDDDTSDPSSVKKKSGWTRQRDRLRGENEQLRARLAELEKFSTQKPAPQAQDQKPAQADDDPEPKIEDYKDVLDYVRATQKWEARQAVKADNVAKKEAETKATEKQAYQKKIDTYRERVEPLLEQVPDFLERVDELAAQGKVSPAIENAVLDNPMSELVTLHLLNNPGDLQIMQSMDDKQAAVAVARIESYIQQSLKTSPSTQTTVAKPTKAAAPIPPTGKSASTSTKAAEDMTQEEYEAHAAKLRRR